MLAKLNESPTGKLGAIFAVVVLVALAIFAGVHFSGGESSQSADPKEVKASAEKQLEVLQKENIPPALKAQLMAHYQGIAGGTAKAGSPAAGEPSSNGSSASH